MSAVTAVFVPGAYHGAWCWDGVIERLGASGLDAVAVELPGHGDDPGPLVDLHEDAARVREVLDGIDGPLVLVGHSYGGAVVTEAGDYPRVAHLVYIAAFNLDEGESVSAVAVDEGAALDHSGRPSLGHVLSPAGPDTTKVKPKSALALFYNDCSDDVARAAAARLGPQLMLNFLQSPTSIAWRSRPSTYAACTLDQAMHPGLQQILARRATHSVEWASGHSPFLSAPDLVAGLIADVMRTVAP